MCQERGSYLHMNATGVKEIKDGATGIMIWAVWVFRLVLFRFLSCLAANTQVSQKLFMPLPWPP